MTTDAEVDDIRDEWLDRYGPLPKPAEALLRVGRLRAACARTGVKEVAVARDVARLARLALKTSQTIRLHRQYPKAVYKEDLGQVVMPLPRGVDAADYVIAFLGAMVPVEAPSVA